jgi:hypothetical protein
MSLTEREIREIARDEVERALQPVKGDINWIKGALSGMAATQRGYNRRIENMELSGGAEYLFLSNPDAYRAEHEMPPEEDE